MYFSDLRVLQNIKSNSKLEKLQKIMKSRCVKRSKARKLLKLQEECKWKNLSIAHDFPRKEILLEFIANLHNFSHVMGNECPCNCVIVKWN